MRRLIVSRVAILGLCLAQFSLFNPTVQANPSDPAQKAEWTFMVFLNGKNNLDSYGTMNLNMMEEIGSTKDLNIVVEWGSSNNQKTQRLLIQKDNDKNKVTSPVVEDLGAHDMGDWHNLVEFAKWSAEKYPAKHYFLAVWDHGSGWHSMQMHGDAEIAPTDISWDDETGNHITTEQLGLAVHEISQNLGQKLDVYGSDACLMSMAEVADEMYGSVETFVGSEEVEPAEGWPYTTFLKRWSENPAIGSQEVGKILTEEYVKAYSPGGVFKKRDVTFSSFDMDKLPLVKTAIAALGASIRTLPKDLALKVRSAATKTQSYYYSDYIDMGDFIVNLEKNPIEGLEARALSDVKAAVKAFVPSVMSTPLYTRSMGVAFWMPTSTYTYKRYNERYKTLNFNKGTSWGDAIGYVLSFTN